VTTSTPPASCPVGQFLANYYHEVRLSGAPLLTRCETAINHDWGLGGPAPGIGPDKFSVRWVGRHSFNAGTYTFTASADDGVRVWVDGQLLIDAWRDQGRTTYTATRTLTAGEHEVIVEYYDHLEAAAVQVSWAVAPTSSCSTGQFQASYYQGVGLAGTPVVTRCETAINHDWGLGGPVPGVGPDNFSARWVGKHSFNAGAYAFTASADDGIRVWVNGQLLINEWRDQGRTTHTATRTLTAGVHEVVVEFYDRAEAAAAQVSWAVASSSLTVTPNGTTLSAPASGSGLRQDFLVTNTSSQAVNLNVAAGCGDCVVVTSATTQTSTLSMSAGTSMSVPVQYSTRAGPGMGSLGLTVSVQGQPNTTAQGIVNIQVGGVNTSVRVVPELQVHTVESGKPGTYTFQLRNFGSTAGRFNLQATCTGAVTGCSTAAYVDLNPGETKSATVSFNAGSAALDAEIRLTATHSMHSSTTHSGRVLLDIQPPAASGSFGIVIDPTGGVMREATLLNVIASWAGEPCDAFTPFCVLAYNYGARLNGAAIKSRFGAPASMGAGRVEIRQQQALQLQTGVNSLEVSVCQGSYCETRRRLYHFDPQSSNQGPQIIINPQPGTFTKASLPIYLYVSDDDKLDLSQLRIRHQGQPVADYHVQSFDNGTYATFSLTRTLAPGRNTLQVEICDLLWNCSQKEAIYYLDVSPPAVAISPMTATTANASLTTRVAWSDDADLVNSRREILLNGRPLAVGAASGVTSTETFGVSLEPGLNTLVARICDWMACTEQTAEYFRYVGDREKPRVSAEPFNGNYLNTAQCAVDCFEVTAGYETPAFVLKDQPRSVGLMYRSGQANPRVTIEVDVTDVSSVQPSSYTLRLKNAAGAFVSFTSGSQITFPASRRGTFRLAGQMDVSGLETGVYHYTAVVTTHWTSGTSDEASTPVRVLVVNEKNSPFGAGWTMPGLQRLRFVGGGILLTEGDGSAAFFEGSSCEDQECEYTSPPGDYSTLSLVQQRVRVGTGSNTQFVYEPVNYVRRYIDGTTLRFDLMGRLTSASNRFDEATQYTWQGERLTHVHPRADLPITLNYDGRGKLSTIQDPMGRVSTFTIDAAGDLVSVENVASPAAGGVPEKRLRVQMGYAAHRMTSSTDPNGAVGQYVYDRAGKLERASGPWVTTRVDGVEKQERSVTTFTSREAVLLPAAGSSTGPLRRREEVVASVTNPLQEKVEFWMDRFGAAMQVRDNKGRTDYAYRDGQGRDTLVVSANGDSVRFTWDGTKLMTQRSKPNGGEWVTLTYEYGPYGLVSTVKRKTYETIPPALIAMNSIDSRGLVSQSWSYGKLSTYEYTADFRIRKVTDPGNHAVEYTYGNTDGTNPWANVETVTDQNGAARFQYDAYGRQRRVTNALGDSVRTVYDLVNRPVTVIDANQHSTVTEYDGIYVRKVRDPKGRETEFVPNSVGWTIREIVREPGRTPNPLQALQYSYDLFGRITETTNRRNQTVRFKYDVQGRLTEQRVLNDGTRTTWDYASNDSTVTVTHFDAGGFQVSRDEMRTDPTPEHSIIAGKPLSQATTVVTRGSRVYTVQNISNQDGTESYVRLRTPDLREGQVPYEARYNSVLGQGLVSLGVTGRGATASVYGDLTQVKSGDEGRVSKLTLPTRSTSTVLDFKYPATHNLGSITYTNSSRPELQRKFGVGYEHDPFGRILARTGAPQTDGTRRYERYDYDALGELKRYEKGRTSPQEECVWLEGRGERCIRLPGSTTEWTDTFLYDVVGNRTNRGGVYEGNLLKAVGLLRMEYDADGNMKRKYSTDGLFDQVLEWNALGQLTQVTTTRRGQSRTTTYRYDGLGRRIRKETAGVVREYVYNGAHLILEVDGEGRDLAEYVYYPGVDAPHSMRRRDSAGNWKTYYYLTESPGHVVGLIDENGQVVKEYAYRPFGEITETTPQGVAPVENPLTFTAREWDADVELYFYRARYYDPVLQRFISEDPIGLAGGINPYLYVGNDPINARDPSGLAPCRYYVDILIQYDGTYMDISKWGSGWDCTGAWAQDGTGSWRSDRGESMLGLLDGVQTALDVAGLVPGIGEIADIANAGIYFARGDNVNGGLSLASAVPFVGWGATLGKFGNKVAPTSMVLLRTERNMQKGFSKHGADFGLSGNWNKRKAAEFSRVIHQHVNSPYTQVIPGTYRKQSIINYLDARTGLNVYTDLNGNYGSAWRLSSEQLSSVLTTGRLF